MGGSPEERGGFVYKFKDRADAVAAAIPGFTGIGAGSDVAPFQLPGGRAAMFIVAPYPMSDGSTCELLVWDDLRPWHLRTWAAIKHCLGFN